MSYELFSAIVQTLPVLVAVALFALGVLVPRRRCRADLRALQRRLDQPQMREAGLRMRGLFVYHRSGTDGTD